ncbi:MAG: chitobiase/beta-hexosaminidase C-terminal domain-containing protein [Candidatus Peregrinibacteria bacterium]
MGLTSYRGGANGITILSNNNYVVSSRYWNNGATVDVGAATWGNGTTGTTGPVSTSNSLYNTTPGGVAGPTNGAGYPRVFALTNGNYVVGAYLWDNGATTDVGAVTWGNGTTGVAGAVSTSNSLYGSTASDNVGTSVTVLTNGNYVVYSSLWDNGGIANRGAVTWGNGTTGTTGAVTTSNSLYGSTASDGVGTSVTALTNGNYVVTSTTWDNGGIADRGAVTWGNGTTGITGAVSTSNSLYGSTASDKVGNVGFSNTIIALTNGNYVVGSRDWDNGGTADAGAATLCSGTAGCTGTISTANSILGPSASAGLGTIVEDTVNNHFIVPFATAQKVYSASSVLFDSAPNDYIFGYDPSASYTFTPGFLTAVLNTGSNVTLQANNDITISSAITASNGSGNGGVLTLQAGRSILINANITTDNGNLILYANEKASAGVIDANRSSGTAVITMAGGTVIDAGAGTVTIRMDDGTGNTNRTAGAITLTSITAGTLSVTNTNAGATDTISISPTITNFTLNSAGTFTLGAALTLTGNLTITAGTLDVSSAGCSGASCAVTVFGNWTNTAGTFTARTGTVTLNGAGQTISGSTTFYNLTKSITSADTLIFAAGTTQTITNTLTFNGAASNLLSLRSSSTPTQWSINPQGTRVIGYLDVKDSNNTNATAINMAGIHSVNSLNNTSWGFNTAPILISIADAPDPIKGGSTITITPTGHGDGESDALNFFCNETGSATGATTLCLQGSASTSGDYSSMTCTYAVATGNATRTIYCRAFDGTEYSAERTTTYTVDSIAPGLPSVSPIPAIYTSAQSVSLTAADSSIIYYTIDGSTPTISSTIYTTPVSVSVTTMIKAIAGDAVGNLSGVMSEVFTIQAASSSSASTPTGGGTRPATLERRQAEVKAPLPQTTEHAAALGVMIAPPAPANLPPLLINMRERMIQRMDVLVTKQPSLKAAMERVLQRLDARLAKRGRR